MPYIFLVLFSLLFTACVNPTTTATPSSPSGLPSSQQTDDIDDLKIVEDSIVGKYNLKRGLFNHGQIHQEIDEGYLVIEELDVNNYGYYYVTVVGTTSPETHSGIFYEKGGKFFQKIIYNDENGDLNSSTASAQSHVETIDNLDLTYDENILKIVIDSTKHEILIWERDDGVKTISPKISNALKEAHQEYLDFYKKKCKSMNIQCSEHEYTPVND
jgi:hypothetical protein